MAVALEVAEFFEGDRVAEMQIGRGRVHAELYPQRPSLGKLVRQLFDRNYFDRAMTELPRSLPRSVFIHRLVPRPGCALKFEPRTFYPRSASKLQQSTSAENARALRARARARRARAFWLGSRRGLSRRSRRERPRRGGAAGPIRQYGDLFADIRQSGVDRF